MAYSRAWLDILDPWGNKPITLPALNVSTDPAYQPPAVVIDGPAQGVDIQSYHAEGNALDKIGDLKFRVPMTLRRNLALNPGTQVAIYEAGIADNGTPAPVAHGLITEKSETISKDGHWAEFTCPDLFAELSKLATGGGMAFGFSDTFDSVIAAHINRANVFMYADGHPEAAWTYQQNITGYDGISYAAYHTSLMESLSTLAKNTHSHVKRGKGRSVVFMSGDLTKVTDSGLVLGKLGPNGVLNPTAREIQSLTRKIDGKIVNDIVGVGAGDGVAQLVLADLYNNADFLAGTIPGYNPAYPIKRRARADNGGIDGFDYYIEDTASIATYGRWQDTLQRTDIAPIKAGNTFLLYAEASLYAAMVAAIQWTSQPHETLTVVTEGRGDIRNLAGQLVTVAYRETNADGIVTMDLNGKYVVMEVVSSWDRAGTRTDTWTLSNLGQYSHDGIQTIIGALQKIDAMAVVPQIYPTRENIWLDQPIANGLGVVMTIEQDNSVVRTLEALFTISMMPIYSTAVGASGGTHNHDVTLSSTYTYDAFPGYTHGANGGQYVHGHGSSTYGLQGNHGHPANGSNQGSHGHSDVSVSGGTGYTSIDDVTNGIRTHNHTLLVQGGGTPSSLGDGVVYLRSGGNPYGSVHLQASNNMQGQLGTDYPGSWSATGSHNHTSSGSGGTGANSYSGFGPNVQGYNGFQPSVDSYGTGFTPSVNAHDAIGYQYGTYGYLPQSYYPAATYQTANGGAHTHSQVYGLYYDPAGRATNLTIFVNGVAINSTPYTDNVVTIDLAPYLPSSGTATIGFQCTTLGRLLIHGRIRRHETTVAAKSG